jgi:hypothetical protein
VVYSFDTPIAVATFFHLVPFATLALRIIWVTSLRLLIMAAASVTEQDTEAMGTSRGGLSTKVHGAVDTLGSSVRLLLTPGQASEYGHAEALLGGCTPVQVLTDK